MSSTVTRIDDDGEVCLVVQIGHRREWQGKASVGLKRANATFAEHDIGVAFIEDVFGCQEKLIKRSATGSLQ